MNPLDVRTGAFVSYTELKQNIVSEGNLIQFVLKPSKKSCLPQYNFFFFLLRNFVLASFIQTI